LVLEPEGSALLEDLGVDVSSKAECEWYKVECKLIQNRDQCLDLANMVIKHRIPLQGGEYVWTG